MDECDTGQQLQMGVSCYCYTGQATGMLEVQTERKQLEVEAGWLGIGRWLVSSVRQLGVFFLFFKNTLYDEHSHLNCSCFAFLSKRVVGLDLGMPSPR